MCEDGWISSPPAACTAPLHLPVQLRSLCFLSPVAGSVLEAGQRSPLSHFHAHASNSPQWILDPVRHLRGLNLKTLTKTRISTGEGDPPGSLQKAALSSALRLPLRSCCRCRCPAPRPWLARSVPPPPNTATRSLSDSAPWSEFLRSAAPAAACMREDLQRGSSYTESVNLCGFLLSV